MEPIACALDAGQMQGRLAEMRALGRAGLVSAGGSESHAVLRFSAQAETVSRLRTIVAAEARCCPFLALELTEDSDGVTLAIRAPDGGEPVLAEIVAAFSGSA